MSIDTTMSENITGSGGGRVKRGDSVDTPFKDGVPSTPGLDGDNAINDRNRAPFDKPRSSGGIPVKFFERVSGSPGALDSVFEDKNIIR